MLANNGYTTVFLPGQEGVNVFHANDIDISSTAPPALQGWQDNRGLWMVSVTGETTIAETGFSSALFDARNGFNELNRYLMLWNVAHLWNQGSRFTFNRYRHWVCCLVRTEPGTPPIVIHSQEGITQGDCLAMSLYGVALMPLASRMCETIPEALQPWY